MFPQGGNLGELLWCCEEEAQKGRQEVKTMSVGQAFREAFTPEMRATWEEAAADARSASVGAEAAASGAPAFEGGEVADAVAGGVDGVGGVVESGA